MSSADSSSGSLKSTEETLEHYGLHLEDETKVCWNDDNKCHPRNWSLWAKWYSTAVICWVELYMTGISSAGVCIATSLFMIMADLTFLRLRRLIPLERSTT